MNYQDYINQQMAAQQFSGLGALLGGVGMGNPRMGIATGPMTTLIPEPVEIAQPKQDKRLLLLEV